MKRLIAVLFIIFSTCIFAKNLPFVVLVASYNNESVVEKNINSILNQNYSNYRVLYINDKSTDKTKAKLESILKKHPKRNLVKVIDNAKNMGGLANYYYGIHNHVSDHEVVICLDGDDFFYDRSVLSYLNNIYTRYDVWMTYGQFVFLSNKKVGWNIELPRSVIQKNAYREFTHVPTHLRTFYAWLFKKIKKDDFLWKNNEFFPMAWDMAFMFPMLEMSAGRCKFIRRPTYIYNDLNPINDHKKNVTLQREIAKYIRDLPKYKPIKKK